MSMRSATILAAIAAAVVFAAAAPKSPAVVMAAPVAAAPADSGERPEFTGTWLLDPERSDLPVRNDAGMPRGTRGEGMRQGGRGGFGEGMHEGGRGGRMGGEDRGGARRPPGAMAPVLPPLIHVTQTHSVVSLEDSTGAVLEEISLVPAAADTLAHAPGAQVSHGAWRDSALVVERGGRNGFTLTRAITLEDGGRILVMRTHFEAPDGGRARDFKRVYRRVTSG